MSKTFQTMKLIAISLALLTGGCFGDEAIIEGTWQSTEKIDGNYNMIHVTEQMFGEAQVYFYLDGELYYADYDAAVYVLDRDTIYAIDMSCVPNEDCWPFDFTLTCHMLGESAMDCSGDSAFQDYGVFEFRRIDY